MQKTIPAATANIMAIARATGKLAPLSRGRQDGADSGSPLCGTEARRQEGVAETREHRRWRCPATQDLRTVYFKQVQNGLGGLPERTKICGIKTWRTPEIDISKIQRATLNIQRRMRSARFGDAPRGSDERLGDGEDNDEDGGGSEEEKDGEDEGKEELKEGGKDGGGSADEGEEGEAKAVREQPEGTLDRHPEDEVIVVQGAQDARKMRARCAQGICARCAQDARKAKERNGPDTVSALSMLLSGGVQAHS